MNELLKLSVLKNLFTSITLLLPNNVQIDTKQDDKWENMFAVIQVR